ncbi:primosomal protein N [Clostridium sp. CAG:557]|nr:primosomal protein N [Clostridium sp. CAG:557]
MNEKFIVKVAVEHIVYHLDKFYDYIVPEEFCQNLDVGCRVLVPFGAGNKKRQGIVLQTDFSSDTSKLKSVFAVLDAVPILNDEMLELAKFIKKKYFCTIYDAVKLMIPAGMNFKLHEQFKLCDNFNESLVLNCNKMEKNLISYLKNFNGWASKEVLLNNFGATTLNCLKNLENNSIIQKRELQKRNLSDSKVKMVKLKEPFVSICNVKITPKQKIIYDILTQNLSGISLKELLYFSGFSVSVVDNLVKKCIAEYFEDKAYRDPYKNVKFSCSSKKIILNDEQKAAYNSILELYKTKKYCVSLLYGITGSGKTSVFMRLIEDVITDGSNVIVMVPEIALTPQMVTIFKSKFFDKVAVFHSGLSQAERMDEYKRVKDGLVNVAVGTRSAVFAPFEKIGLIIMDEEQESSYKSDATPRFNAREVAKFRCAYHKSLLLLSSATPSVETFFWAKNKKYSINILKNRYAGAKLPAVSIVDMNKEQESGNFSAFSSKLTDKLTQNLNNGNQSILLLNRRGYHTLVSCKSCGQVLMCPNCSIALTLHSANKKLMCHYCGFSTDITDKCPNCHKHQLKYIGVGTQKVEEDLKKFFPEARILRMDTDSMMSKFSYENKLRDFAYGKYDIMLGTQMVAKGLDFPNVTLVGVLSADQSLYSGDFKSYERTFSLLTQVVGRAGRNQHNGFAVIQTFTPENPIINLAAKQDYDSFYADEIILRKALLYPPFAKLCVIGFVGEKEFNVMNAAKFFFEILKDLIKTNYFTLTVRILGPSPAQIFKVNGKFRYKIIIKFKDEKIFRNFISDALIKFGNCKKFTGISTFVDLEPDSIL